MRRSGAFGAPRPPIREPPKTRPSFSGNPFIHPQTPASPRKSSGLFCGRRTDDQWSPLQSTRTKVRISSPKVISSAQPISPDRKGGFHLNKGDSETAIPLVFRNYFSKSTVTLVQPVVTSSGTSAFGVISPLLTFAKSALY